MITTEFVRIDDEERMKFIRHIFRRRRRFWLIVAGVGVVVALVGWGISEMFMFATGTGLAFAGVADLWWLDYYLRRMLRDPQNKVLQQRSRGIYTAEKVTIESEDGTVGSFPWPSFVKIEKLGEDYLLYVARNNAILIFRRNHTEEQWAQFTQWAEARRVSQSAPHGA
jgi:hypothetical protein